MSGQQTYFVNCPYCSAIVEVVNPKPGRDPRQVEACTSEPYITKSRLTCPNCKTLFYIAWWYP